MVFPVMNYPQWTPTSTPGISRPVWPGGTASAPMRPMWPSPVPYYPPYVNPYVQYAPRPATWPPVTYVPVIRQAPPGTSPGGSASFHPPAPPSAVDPAAASPASSQTAAVPSETSAAPQAKKTDPPPKPLTPAEQTGKKVGDMVTRILEENPQLQQKVDQMNLDYFLENPGAMGNDIRRSIQQSRLFKMLPKQMDQHIAGMFPSDMEPAVKDVLTWLRSPVDASASTSGLSGISGSSSTSGASGASPFSMADLLGTETSATDVAAETGKRGLIGRLLGR